MLCVYIGVHKCVLVMFGCGWSLCALSFILQCVLWEEFFNYGMAWHLNNYKTGILGGVIDLFWLWLNSTILWYIELFWCHWPLFWLWLTNEFLWYIIILSGYYFFRAYVLWHVESSFSHLYIDICFFGYRMPIMIYSLKLYLVHGNNIFFIYWDILTNDASFSIDFVRVWVLFVVIFWSSISADGNSFRPFLTIWLFV